MTAKKTVKKPGKVKQAMTKGGVTLKRLWASGKRKIILYYTRKGPDGKTIPNYKTISLTTGIIAAAGAGVYLVRRHKKHGYIIQKKKK